MASFTLGMTLESWQFRSSKNQEITKVVLVINITTKRIPFITYPKPKHKPTQYAPLVQKHKPKPSQPKPHPLLILPAVKISQTNIPSLPPSSPLSCNTSTHPHHLHHIPPPTPLSPTHHLAFNDATPPCKIKQTKLASTGFPAKNASRARITFTYPKAGI